MQDARVRKAINMAIDREGIAREIYHGTGRAEYGMLSPGTDAYDPNFKSYSYDPEAAKKLLAEAGYANGFKTGLRTAAVRHRRDRRNLDAARPQEDRHRRRTAEVRVGDLYGPMGGRDEAGYRHERDRLGHVDAGMDQHRLALRQRAAGGENSGWYCNKDVDKTAESAAILERDTAKMKAIYQKANRLIMDDAAFVPYVDDLQPMMLSPKVKGFVNPPEDWFDLSTVSME